MKNYIKKLSAIIVLIIVQVVAFVVIFTIAINNAEAKDNKTIDIRDYGAVGDGIADDYMPLYLAIHDAIETHKKLYIPFGKYYSSSTIVIDGDLSLYGDGKNESIIIYKDTVNNVNEKNTRAMLTFDADYLTMEGITIKYEANNSTGYIVNSADYKPGLLVCILQGKKIALSDCVYQICGNINVPVTCMWMKSEVKDICNVSVENCEFINSSKSGVGGGLWISAHDNENTSIKDITVHHCCFEKNGNDEALAIWGYHTNNVDVYKNSFVFCGDRNDVLIKIGTGSFEGEYKKIRFHNNSIEIVGGSRMGVRISNISRDSDISISNNSFNSHIAYNDFTCMSFWGVGNARVSNNKIDIFSGKTIAYMAFDGGGNIIVSGDKVATYQTVHSMIVKSESSKDNSQAYLAIRDASFSFGTDNKVSELSTIQFPASGNLSIEKTKFSTSNSCLHELKIQNLYDNNSKERTSELELVDIKTDANIIMHFDMDTKRKLCLKQINANQINFVFPTEAKYLEEIVYKDIDQKKFRINYKNATFTDLAKYCNGLSEE